MSGGELRLERQQQCDSHHHAHAAATQPCTLARGRRGGSSSKQLLQWWRQQGQRQRQQQPLTVARADGACRGGHTARGRVEHPHCEYWCQRQGCLLLTGVSGGEMMAGGSPAPGGLTCTPPSRLELAQLFPPTPIKSAGQRWAAWPSPPPCCGHAVRCLLRGGLAGGRMLAGGTAVKVAIAPTGGVTFQFELGEAYWGRVPEISPFSSRRV